MSEVYDIREARERIRALEAALHTACDWLSAELHAAEHGSAICEPDSDRMRSFLTGARALLT